MSLRIATADIISRLQAFAMGQTPEEPDQSRRNFGSHNDNGHYDPSPTDIAVVRIMLAKATRLPVDIVDGIFEQAEYWVHTSTVADYSDSPLTVRNGNGEDKFLIRSLPIGFTNDHGGDLDVKRQQPAPVKPLQSRIPAETLAKMTDYPVPRLQGPVRKIVFNITSHDQGWSSETGGLYENSWTWFEAGLERLEGNEIDEPRKTPPTPLHVQMLRPVYPSVKTEPLEEEKREDARVKVADGDAEQAQVDSVKDSHTASAAEPEFRYDFDLLHSAKWTVCRNKRAHRDWQKHQVTWSCFDDIKPDSDGGKALEDGGRGRESGNGEFVRNLELGDVVTLWAKARFPMWVNTIKDVRMDVYWAAT